MPQRQQDLNLIDGLFQLSFLLHRTLARAGAEHDLSIIQVRLLGILRDREPGMLELAKYLELEKSSLSGLVSRAEQRGLVKRTPSGHDGRAATVRMTAQGRRLSRVVEERVTAKIAALVGILSEGDRDRLTTLVSKVVTTAGA